MGFPLDLPTRARKHTIKEMYGFILWKLGPRMGFLWMDLKVVWHDIIDIVYTMKEMYGFILWKIGPILFFLWIDQQVLWNDILDITNRILRTLHSLSYTHMAYTMTHTVQISQTSLYTEKFTLSDPCKYPVSNVSTQCVM